MQWNLRVPFKAAVEKENLGSISAGAVTSGGLPGVLTASSSCLFLFYFSPPFLLHLEVPPIHVLRFLACLLLATPFSVLKIELD
jgi:hypothetical protein